MCLMENAFEKIEELIDLIPNIERDSDLEFAVEQVTLLMERDIYSYSSSELSELAYDLLRAMENLWDLIPRRKRNLELREYYEGIMQDLESETVPRPDEPSLEDYLDDDSEFDEYSEDDEEEDEWD